MEGHRNQEVRVAEQGPSGSVQPAGEGRRVIQPVAVLEGEDERFGGIVVVEERAGARESFGRARQAPHIVSLPGSISNDEPQQEHSAFDKRDRVPARGAEAMRLPTLTRHDTQSGGKMKLSALCAPRRARTGKEESFLVHRPWPTLPP